MQDEYETALLNLVTSPRNSPIFGLCSREIDRQGLHKWSSIESRNESKRIARLVPG